MSAANAHDVTLRLLEELTRELPDERRERVAATYRLIARLLQVTDSDSIDELVRQLLQDALSV